MLNFSRVSASQPSLAVALHRMPHSACKLLVLLQTSDKQTTVEPRADADQQPPIPPLSPSASVSTHLARFVGARDMYMRNYTVDFPNGSRRRRKKGAVFMLDCAACYVAHRLACSRLARTFRWLFFIRFSHRIFFFSSRCRFAPLANAAGGLRLGLALGIIYYA